ncbi:MAG: MarR family transcriptional regulator [Clostridia bacterium]|nr:MarR family transcriptional regulator [Clostridia bacterium]
MEDKGITSEERLTRLLRACGRRLYYSSCAGRTQAKVLTLLCQAGAMSQKDIQQKLEVKPGSVSELISKLEMKGLVKRVRAESDRRRVLLTLTEQGERAAAMASKRRDTVIDYKVLAADERVEMLFLLEKLVKSWEEEEAPVNSDAQDGCNT